MDKKPGLQSKKKNMLGYFFSMNNGVHNRLYRVCVLMPMYMYNSFQRFFLRAFFHSFFFHATITYLRSYI